MAENYERNRADADANLKRANGGVEPDGKTLAAAISGSYDACGEVLYDHHVKKN